jgi:hypothetical protein
MRFRNKETLLPQAAQGNPPRERDREGYLSLTSRAQ